jgi:hypothetical protein
MTCDGCGVTWIGGGPAHFTSVLGMVCPHTPAPPVLLGGLLLLLAAGSARPAAAMALSPDGVRRRAQPLAAATLARAKGLGTPVAAPSPSNPGSSGGDGAGQPGAVASFEVAVPGGVAVGDHILVVAPNGAKVRVRVPEGATPGAMLAVEMPRSPGTDTAPPPPGGAEPAAAATSPPPPLPPPPSRSVSNRTQGPQQPVDGASWSVGGVGLDVPAGSSGGSSPADTAGGASSPSSSSSSSPSSSSAVAAVNNSAPFAEVASAVGVTVHAVVIHGTRVRFAVAKVRFIAAWHVWCPAHGRDSDLRRTCIGDAVPRPPPPPALPSLLCVGQLSHVALIIGHVKRELHGYALLKDAITSANASSSGGVSAARPLRCCSRCVPAPLQAAEQLALPAYAGRFHRVRGRF